MPKATAVFDADDSRLSSALARINGKMLALQSRIAKFAGAFLEIRAAAGVVTAGFDHFKQALDVGGQLNELSANTGVAVADHKSAPAPSHLDVSAKTQFLAGQAIYHREGRCATCHLPNGADLDPAFPSLVNSEWVAGDADRLIKLTLFGLMGPLEINGKKYDGQVPMTPFGGMLKDEEIASVLTFVRNSFGNQAPPIKAQQVQQVRTAYPGRVNFFTTEELLKEHPLTR